jgi:ABC-type multidrug transport system permease subunit
MYPAHSLMDERERGLMAMLGSTPLRPVELWLGVAAPTLIIAMGGTLTQIALMRFAAGVPLRGDPALLLAGLALFALIHVNLGCLMPLVAKNGSQRTLYGLVLVFLLLSISGFLIPQAFLPAWTRRIAEAVPLKHGLVFARAVFLKGVGAHALARELTALGIAAAATSAGALAGLRALLRAQRSG